MQILGPSKGPGTQIVDNLGPNGFLYIYFGHLFAYCLGTWTLRDISFIPIHHHSDPWPARCQRLRFRSDLQRGFHPGEGSSSILGYHFLGGFHNKDHSILVPMLGPPCLWKLPFWRGG